MSLNPEATCRLSNHSMTPGKLGAELAPAVHVPTVAAPDNRRIPMLGCPWDLRRAGLAHGRLSGRMRRVRWSLGSGRKGERATCSSSRSLADSAWTFDVRAPREGQDPPVRLWAETRHPVRAAGMARVPLTRTVMVWIVLGRSLYVLESAERAGSHKRCRWSRPEVAARSRCLRRRSGGRRGRETDPSPR